MTQESSLAGVGVSSKPLKSANGAVGGGALLHAMTRRALNNSTQRKEVRAQQLEITATPSPSPRKLVPRLSTHGKSRGATRLRRRSSGALKAAQRVSDELC